MIRPRRTNTILYSDRWPEMVAFYRDTLGLTATFENDWFVEFDLGYSAHVSIADASRTTIRPGRGAGITLSWFVDDLAAARARLVDAGIEISDGHRFSAVVIDLHDPEGNRIELWSDPP